MAKKAFYETKEFKRLDAEWKQKLEASGFIDIEKGETETVIRPEIIKDATGDANYFQFCNQILREHRFKRDLDRIIFSLHTDEVSEREIVKILEERYNFKMSRKAISLVIHRTKEAFLKVLGT